MQTVSRGWIPTPSENFGERLALVRQRHAWNTQQAADLAGVDAESWRGWETLGRRPRKYDEVCHKIAEASGVDYFWLMTGVNPYDPDGLPRLDSNQKPSDYREHHRFLTGNMWNGLRYAAA